MLILGIILIVVGLLVPALKILFTLGIIFLVVGLVVGLVLFALGASGRKVGGRNWY